MCVSLTDNQSNFLYNPAVQRGVLVDFGLAEVGAIEPLTACLCLAD